MIALAHYFDNSKDSIVTAKCGYEAQTLSLLWNDKYAFVWIDIWIYYLGFIWKQANFLS